MDHATDIFDLVSTMKATGEPFALARRLHGRDQVEDVGRVVHQILAR